MNYKEGGRIFIGPYEIAGFSCSLRAGFKTIGVNARFIDLWGHPYDYGGSENEGLENCLRTFKREYLKHTKKQLPGKLFFGTLSAVWTFIHFFKALFRYDVFIFIFGYSLLPFNLDLPVLKMAGKKILFNIALGSEARPPYMNGVYQSRDGSGSVSLTMLARLTKKVKRTVSRIERWSDVVIGSPFSSSQFTEKEFVNYFSLGFPRVTQPDISETGRSDTCRIVHSPSHPAAKGTSRIEEAVENLRKKGHRIDFILLKNKTNREVLSELQNCDFVIDQLYSDTPLGGFACEAASFARPAVVGGYACTLFETYIPRDMIPPSFCCHPDTVQEVIEKLIENKDLRVSAGLASRMFVREQWSAETVARRYLRLVSGSYTGQLVCQSGGYCICTGCRAE